MMMSDYQPNTSPWKNPYRSTLGKKRSSTSRQRYRSKGKIRDIPASQKTFTTTCLVPPKKKETVAEDGAEKSNENPKSPDDDVANPPTAPTNPAVEARRAKASRKSYCTSTFQRKQRKDHVTVAEEKDPASFTESSPSINVDPIDSALGEQNSGPVISTQLDSSVALATNNASDQKLVQVQETATPNSQKDNAQSDQPKNLIETDQFLTRKNGLEIKKAISPGTRSNESQSSQPPRQQVQNEKSNSLSPSTKMPLPNTPPPLDRKVEANSDLLSQPFSQANHQPANLVKTETFETTFSNKSQYSSPLSHYGKCETSAPPVAVQTQHLTDRKVKLNSSASFTEMHAQNATTSNTTERRDTLATVSNNNNHYSTNVSEQSPHSVSLSTNKTKTSVQSSPAAAISNMKAKVAEQNNPPVAISKTNAKHTPEQPNPSPVVVHSNAKKISHPPAAAPTSIWRRFSLSSKQESISKSSRQGDGTPKQVGFVGFVSIKKAGKKTSKKEPAVAAASSSSTSTPTGPQEFLPPSLKRFSSHERTLKEQINSLTPNGRNCLALFRQQWDSDHLPMPGHLVICFARFCGFNLVEGRKLLAQFEERYLRLTATHLEPQLLTQTIFPVPGLKSTRGLDMCFMRPALFYPRFMKTQTIVDNLAYVMLSMVEKEEAATNGIGILIYMNEFTAENFSVAYWRHFMKMLQGGVPARVHTILIVNAPSWFAAQLKAMKRDIQPDFYKRMKMVQERLLSQYLSPGFQNFLPDETVVGSASTTEMVKDFVAYRKYIEASRGKPTDW